MRKTGFLVAALLGMTPCVTALAHPLAPALLELRETAPLRFEVLWRTSVVQVRGAEVTPELPANCVDLGPESRSIRDNEALELRRSVQCDSLAGRPIAVRGLDGSGINVVLRIEALGGRVVSGILDARHPEFVVPGPGSRMQRFGGYFSLGTRHLLSGLDHVLFVLGLLILIRGWRPLVVTITAFTVGHSLTLAAATLGLVRASPALTELGIALSLIAVAGAILRPGAVPSLLQRHPASITLAFGLLHGLGFAGALSGVGLPAAEIPLSLLAFNLGIEAGQLALVAVALALAGGARRWGRPGLAAGPALTRVMPAYIIGSLAACWCIERTMVLLS